MVIGSFKHEFAAGIVGINACPFDQQPVHAAVVKGQRFRQTILDDLDAVGNIPASATLEVETKGERVAYPTLPSLLHGRCTDDPSHRLFVHSAFDGQGATPADGCVQMIDTRRNGNRAAERPHLSSCVPSEYRSSLHLCLYACKRKLELLNRIRHAFEFWFPETMPFDDFGKLLYIVGTYDPLHLVVAVKLIATMT